MFDSDTPGRCQASATSVFGLVLISELFRVRLEWFWYLVQRSFVPLASLAFLYYLWDDPRSAQFAVTGSLVNTMTTSAMLSLGQYLGHMKDNNAFEHYAALPVSRTTFVAALATRGVLLTLPSLLTVALIGRWALDIPLTPIGLVSLLLGAYAMSGLGAFMGFWSKDAQTASLSTQVLATVIIYLSPVYIPLEQLPALFRWTSVLIPTTYAASALRLSTAGAGLTALWPDLLALLGFAMVSLFLVPLRLPWRQA